jgi:endonuclease G, mitochondrial
MTTDELKQGLQQLDQLSKADYHEPLSDVIAAKNPEEVFKRVGRLVGVVIKEPFAEPKDLPAPSRETRSYRAWDLQPERLADSTAKSTWQYRTLEVLRTESPAAGHLASVQELAIDAHHERGFFGHLARSVQKYICDDPKLRKQIDKNLAAAKAAGFSAKHLRPETFVTSGGLALGTLLVAHIPFLGVVGAPVIAGIVLVLYSIGTNAFCSYVKDQYAQKEK